MVQHISCQALQALLDGKAPFALIDVREAGEHNSSHIPDSSLIPRRQLEFQMTIAVPVQDVHVVLYDDNGKRADLAAATLGANRQLRRPHPQHHRHPGAQRLGLHNVSGLKNGTSGWVLAGYDLETGADRLDLPEPSPEGLAAAEAYADRLAAEDGVRDIDRWETALGDKFATS